MPDRSPTRRHLLTLTAICALAYFLGLTAQGVTAWHEGQRLLVARQMLEAGEWIVPRINDHPYLAKPPLFYWVQMVLAAARGSGVTLLDTRLGVAIFGWLGVIATYLAARDILSPHPLLDPRRGAAWARTAAFWAAAALATGLDYARSARIGELDILLVAPCIVAVWMVVRAWRAHLDPDRPRTDWAACFAAALAASIAGLTKGPPALAVIAVGAYGSILVHTARSHGPLQAVAHIPLLTPPNASRMIHPGPPSALATGLGAALGAAVALFFSIPQVEDARDALGAAVGAGLAALAIGSLAPLVGPARARAALAALSRTHPILVLGLPLLVLWVWIAAVNARIEPGLLDTWAGEEVTDNLRPFRPESPLTILEVASFGVGIGSVAFIATVAWLIRARPALPVGWVACIVWAVGVLVVFSLFGKGLGRYVLPAWPAMAMVGGIGIATALRGLERRRAVRLRAVLVAAVSLLTVGESVWYGALRATYFPHRSSRDFVAELLSTGLVADPSRVACLDLYDPGIDYYLDVLTPDRPGPRSQPVGDVRTRVNLTGIPAWTIERFADEVRRTGPWTIIARERPVASNPDPRPASERLAAAGLVVTVFPVGSEMRLNAGWTRLIALRVEALSPAAGPGDSPHPADPPNAAEGGGAR